MQSDDASARALEALWAYGARQSDLGRAFARHMGMHTTDAAAVTEILRAEERGHPLTPARLAERIGLTSGATSILLNRLEEAGHITRLRERTDRRLVTLRSAPAVHEASRLFSGPLRSRLRETAASFSPQELAVVERFIADICATLDAFSAPEPGRTP
ncbi:MarR family transcriptional regulator [Streptomyces sp. NPDC049916]|uniref:MarR family winged helix-turn-helix transcriptional regulator n=1 Tax=Streptomyces sp. NPDC049916 TaxID=3155156 RepID=UPI00341C0617